MLSTELCHFYLIAGYGKICIHYVMDEFDDFDTMLTTKPNDQLIVLQTHCRYR